MFKKFLSIILAVSLMLTLAFAVNTAAAGKWAIDLSGYEAGTQYSKLGNGYKTFVVEEDGKKCVLFANSGAAYGESDHLTDRLTLPISGGLPEDTKGIIVSTTFKTNSIGHSILLTPGYAKTPRYMVGGNGKLRIDGAGSNTDTGLTYAADAWINTKLSINFTTGYYILEKTDVATGVVTKYASTNENLKKTCDAATMAAFTSIDFWKDGTAGKVYVSDFSIESVNDADAIAPSRVIVRDDFDDNTDALTGWSGGGVVAETDRGKSAEIVCAVAERRINRAIELPSDAKGLVSEFSVKLTGTGGTEFIYAAGQNSKDAWTNAGARLIQFASNGKMHAFNGKVDLGSYKADTWYDIRIENNYVNDFTRISISDGKNESVAEIVNSTTYYDTVTNIVRLDFVSSTAMATPKSIYIDDINIYWIDETEVSGLKNPRTYTLHNEFENFAEGDMQEDLVADATCDATKSFKVTPVEDEFEVGIESVVNSGRGKSFKAANLTGSKSREFYKDFLAIEEGIIEFDVMLAEKNGAVVIENQVSDSGNGNMGYVTAFRFTEDGTITDGTSGEALGNYDADKWYHAVLSSGTYDVDGESKTAVLAQLYENGEAVAESLVRTDLDSISRNSIRNAKFTIGGLNTVYVDNFRVYPAAGEQGIYPTPSILMREKTIAPDGELIIPFSKVVDLTNSKFKVNGEVVSAVLLGGNVVKLNKTITSGEEYEIEYTATDLDGFTTKGYIGGIKAVKGLIIEDYTAATLEAPTASVKVTVNSVYLAKNVQLIVATYNESESRVIDIDITSAAAGTGEQTLTATASTEGAAKIKTLFWDGISLVPVSID